MQSRNGTVVRWDDALIETYGDGSGLVWAQVETLVPDRALARGLGDGLAMFYGECSVTVLNGFVVLRVPDVLRESERILRQVVDQSARSAEFKYRKAIGVA